VCSPQLFFNLSRTEPIEAAVLFKCFVHKSHSGIPGFCQRCTLLNSCSLSLFQTCSSSPLLLAPCYPSIDDPSSYTDARQVPSRKTLQSLSPGCHTAPYKDTVQNNHRLTESRPRVSRRIISILTAAIFSFLSFQISLPLTALNDIKPS